MEQQKTDFTSRVSQLKQISLFSELPEEMVMETARRAVSVKLEAQEVFRSPYHKCRNISCVLTGSLKIVREDKTEEETVIRHIGEGEVFGEAIAFTGKHYPGWFIAVGKTEILNVPIDELIDMCQYQHFLVCLLRAVYRKVDYLSQRIELLSGSTAGQKLRQYLLSLHEKQETSELMLPVTKTELAGELGCSRETLSRLLSKLQKEHIIAVKGRRISIQNRTWLFRD